MADMSSNPGGPSKPTLLQVIGSVLSAAIGVQSDANRERDFTQGSFKTFVIVGLLFAVAFVVGLLAIVNAVL